MQGLGQYVDPFANPAHMCFWNMQLGYSLQGTDSIPVAPIFTSAVAEAQIVGKLTI